MKQKGFTLIELLVVIVIIGILATISVATFSGYFSKARDSERQAAVRNAATVLKTARAVETITTFTDTKANIASTLSAEGGFAVPAASATGFDYYYYSSAQDEFVVFVCAEDASTNGQNAQGVLRDGTAADLATLDAETTVTCASGAMVLGSGTIGTAVGTDSSGSFKF